MKRIITIPLFMLFLVSQVRASFFGAGSGEFFTGVSRGLLAGHRSQVIVGRNAAVGTSLETLWQESTTYTFPPSATTMTVSSGNANDTSAGTGARTVRIFWLDNTYAEQTTDLALNGQTGVTIATNVLRVQGITVLTAGSGGVNAGILYVGSGTVTLGVPANIYGMVQVGFCTSLHGFWTVPTGKSLYLTTGTLIGGASDDGQVRLIIRPEGSVFQVPLISNFTEVGATVALDTSPFRIPAHTDLKIQAQSNAGSSEVTVILTGVLIDD